MNSEMLRKIEEILRIRYVLTWIKFYKQRIWTESFVWLLYNVLDSCNFVYLYDLFYTLEFQLSRREISIQQYDVDLAQVKQQYREAVEENGRLEARIQAFAINAQSEQDVLSSEVKKNS